MDRNKFTHSVYLMPCDEKTGFQYSGWSCIYDDSDKAQEYFRADLGVQLYERFMSLATESMMQAQDHKENGRDLEHARAKARAVQAQECADDVRLWLRLNRQDIENTELSKLKQAVKLIIDEITATDEMLSEGLVCGISAKQQSGILKVREILKKTDIEK